MRIFKKLLIAASILGVFSLAACTKDKKTTDSSKTTKITTKSNTSSKKTTEKKTTDKKEDFDDEVAMDNFVEKVKDANYVIKGEDFETSVYSKNQVTLRYDREGYADYAIMSVNEEVFQAKITGNNLSNITFVDYNEAHTACSNKLYTINYIVNMSFGNMFDIFTNITDEDGKYVTNSVYAREFIMTAGGYSPQIESAMQEIYLTFDSEDVNEAHLTTKFYNAVSHIDIDVDFKITFGNAKSFAPVDAWLKNPVYPEAQTDWSLNQLGALEFVFCLYPDEDVTKYVPFYEGASYAVYFDYDVIKVSDSAYIYDKHVSESNVALYKEKLVNDYGFTLINEDDEEYYQKTLRSESNSFVRIYIEYDEGIQIYPKIYFDTYKTGDADEINSKLQTNGFVTLNKIFNEIYAEDVLYKEMEAYLHISEYDLVYMVDLYFEALEEADQYLNSYLEDLVTSGFSEKQGEFGVYYEDSYSEKKVWYNIDDNLVQFKFKADKVYSFDDINTILSDSDFENIGTNDVIHMSSKDMKDFEYIKNSQDFDVYREVMLYFEDTDTLDSYLDAYEAILLSNSYNLTEQEEKVTGKIVEYDDGVHHVGIEAKGNVAILIFAK